MTNQEWIVILALVVAVAAFIGGYMLSERNHDLVIKHLAARLREEWARGFAAGEISARSGNRSLLKEVFDSLKDKESYR